MCLILENKDTCSGCSKKIAGDTRNNWVTMMFKTKCNYNCFQKQQHIDTCTQAFHKLERYGYMFGDFGFAWNHVHFQVNIPKRYSLQTAEVMMKSYTSRCMFETHPGFRRRYPRGCFWSGYEHHQSTGLTNLEESSNYLRYQLQHHNMVIVDDRQQKLVAAE
jgi:REP element-mobilizing transposase RayT